MERPDPRGVGAFCLLAAALALASGCPAGTTGSAAPHNLPARAKPREAVPREPTIDNGRCFVCHANYQEEPLVQFHAAGGIGCEKCHGESKTHTNDEDNVTAPQVMYPREKINAACLGCHAGFQYVREPDPVPGAPAGGVVCTDCHFKHRLPRRDRVWDKNTGKLLSQPPANRMTTPQ